MLGPSPRARHTQWRSSQGRSLRAGQSIVREFALMHRRAPESIPPWPDRSISTLGFPVDERKPEPALADSPEGPDSPSYKVRGPSSERSRAPSRTTAEPVRTADLQPKRMQGAYRSPRIADPARGRSSLAQ